MTPGADPAAVRRGEVVMTVQDAKKKRLPKGYTYEAIGQPPALIMPSPEASFVDTPVEGKRARRQTPKAIEAVSVTKRGGGARAPSFTPPAQQRDPMLTPGPQPSTSTVSEDPEEKARKKEAKRQLKEELARIRAMQQQAEEKEVVFTTPAPKSTPSARPPSSQQFTTPSPAPRLSVDIPVDTGPDGRAKRTPKANSFYTSGVEGDFLTGNAKIPGSLSTTSKSKGKLKTLKKSSGKVNPREEKRKSVEKDRVFRMERLFHHCASVLRNVESRNRNACLFLEPVDAAAIPDYYEVITHPMDFLTIKQSLESKGYETPLEFASDIRQVFANCKIYNTPDSVEAGMGLDVEADFERRWVNSKISDKWEQELMRRDTEETEIANTPVREPERPTPSKTAKTPTPKPGGSSLKRKTPSSARDANDTSRPMTFEEKRALSTALEQLPADKLGRVVEIIQESDALGDDDKEELELDIDLLDPETLWKLQRYASGCLKPTKKVRKQAPGMTSQKDPEPSIGSMPTNGNDDEPESSSGSGSSTSSG